MPPPGRARTLCEVTGIRVQGSALPFRAHLGSKRMATGGSGIRSVTPRGSEETFEMPAMSPRPTTAFPVLQGRQGAWGGGLKHMGAESPQHNTLNKITTKTRGHEKHTGKRRKPQYIWLKWSSRGCSSNRGLRQGSPWRARLTCSRPLWAVRFNCPSSGNFDLTAPGGSI